MKNRLTLLIAMAVVLAAPLAKAQTPESPADYTLKKDADFAKHEKNVKEDVAWYIKSPIDKNEKLRNEIAAFLLAWVAGSPVVTENLGKVENNLLPDSTYKYNAEVLVAYMGGMAVYELNNPNDKDEANIEVAGVNAVLELYKNNTSLLVDSKGIKKVKDMSKDDLMKFVKACIAEDKQMQK